MCCICLIEDNNYIQLDCGHKLHKECLTKLLDYSNKCPMCRANLFKNICNCFFFSPYAGGDKCRFCFGVNKKIKKIDIILQ